ncbi:hypothetical protein MELE44368_21480 [Mycolicibacterium elephantis DSM 44368]|uniref:Uncharacterized protein n=1 Tax=Mycolicibacterium elephantis DSM 44368 TaxID=1335622 RepID=A0A439DSR0_9MYCO|nr:hypothetical protein MELE44368_21480 [Mycolicibacterium elephantis DSM 44368]
MFIAAITDLTDSRHTGQFPVSLRCRATGRSPRRSMISSWSMSLHVAGPSANPNWKAEIRSNADPCSPPRDTTVLPLSSGSRNEIPLASKALRPSPVDRVKRRESPAAIQRM